MLGNLIRLGVLCVFKWGSSPSTREIDRAVVGEGWISQDYVEALMMGGVFRGSERAITSIVVKLDGAAAARWCFDEWEVFGWIVLLMEAIYRYVCIVECDINLYTE